MFAPFHRNRSGRWVNVFTGGTQQCSAVYSATCCNWCSMLIGDLLEREIILLAKDRIWICGYLPTTYSLHTHSYSYFIHRTQCRSCIFDRVVFFLFFSLVLHSFVLFWPFRFHCCCCCLFFYFFLLLSVRSQHNTNRFCSQSYGENMCILFNMRKRAMVKW